MKILTKEYIYKHGKDISEIGYDPVRAMYVIWDTDIPYNGIAYSEYDDNEIESYCFYKNGYADGEEVDFYPNGKVKTWNNFSMGKGECKEWYENGTLMAMGKFEDNICLEYKVWDENGGLIEEKKEPTVDDRRRMRMKIKKNE